MVSQKRTAVSLILLPFLINLPLQNTIFLVKIDPRWPNSPQMRDAACFELGRSAAAGQQKHFSCFFGRLKNLEVWGFALTPSFPCARFSWLGSEDGAPGSTGQGCRCHTRCRLPARLFLCLSSAFLRCHETEDRIIKLPFSQRNVAVSRAAAGRAVARCQSHMPRC